MFQRLGKTVIRTGLIAIAACVGGAAAAYATIPDGNGVVHGCYQKNSGQLRVIDSSKASCNTGSEIGLNWNQTGRKGVTGAQGPKGPTGPQGANGVGTTVISGIVGAGGDVRPGADSGLFSVTRLGLGEYKIDFPAGTWAPFTYPAVAVTPFLSVTPWTTAAISSEGNDPGGNGSASVTVEISNANDQSRLVDEAFAFIATQP